MYINVTTLPNKFFFQRNFILLYTQKGHAKNIQRSSYIHGSDDRWLYY